MKDIETVKEHQQRIDAVIDYILKHIDQPVSLKSLADVAHYSPFYFQKLFKQLTGESPKQYIIKVRLETTLLLLIIHPYKSLKEIAISCGFSSPAVFSRSVKNYFGISPEEIRAHSPKERMQLFRNKNSEGIPHAAISHENVSYQMDVQVKKVETIRGFYLTAPCDDMDKIQESFKQILQIAKASDLPFEDEKIYGILNPHQGNIYKTFMPIDNRQQLPRKFKVTEIKSGKYVSYKISGDIRESIRSGHFIYHHWLPQNGYKIAGIARFEVFSANPAVIPYQQLQREVYIPIEPL